MIQKSLYNNFNGKKLEQARAIRNKTLQETAEAVGLTHQSISKYEKNKAIPSIEVLQKLSDFLNFELTFFYTAEIESTFFEHSFIYRSKASVAKKYKDQTETKIGLIDLLVKHIRTKVNIPSFDNNLLKRESIEFKSTPDEEIERITLAIREKFHLSDGPISNITALCEKLGLYVFFLDLEEQGIDACSVLIKETPYIILNKNITSSVRIRFNIAHELGHIILHSSYDRKIVNKSLYSKQLEYEANLFASSLLLPDTGISKDLSALGLDYLLILKKHWLVSIQAIIYRAEKLEIYTPEYSLYLRQQISRKKWRTFEPYDDEIPIEKPKLFTHALNYLQNKMNYSISQLSFDTGIKAEEILCYCITEELISNENIKASNGLKRIK